jgi:hypothetical protein
MLSEKLSEVLSKMLKREESWGNRKENEVIGRLSAEKEPSIESRALAPISQKRFRLAPRARVRQVE